MGVFHRVADLEEHVHDLARVEALADHAPVNLLTLDVLHREVVDALDPADLVNRDDVGVAEAGHGAGLALEGLAKGQDVAALAREDLHRHDPIEVELASLVDDPHPAAGDLAQDRVGAEAALLDVGLDEADPRN